MYNNCDIGSSLLTPLEGPGGVYVGLMQGFAHHCLRI